jgi:hypothetical protein
VAAAAAMEQVPVAQEDFLEEAVVAAQQLEAEAALAEEEVAALLPELLRLEEELALQLQLPQVERVAVAELALVVRFSFSKEAP